MTVDDVRLGDLVTDVRWSDDSRPYKVVGITPKLFTVDIGLNERTGQRMTRTYRKADGKSVGDKWHVSYVRRCSTNDAAGEPK